jgi:Secretion system C-terminal sorting domain
MKKLIILFLCAAPEVYVNAQAILRVAPGTNFFVNNNIKLVLNNTGFENNGNLGAGINSRFIFTGNTAIASVSGTSNILFGELEIDKNAGVLQLNRFVNIYTGVYFTNGNIDLNNNRLTLIADPNGQLVGENNNSRIFGNSGNVRKLATLNAPTNANPGNIGVSITSAANLGSTFIDRYHNDLNGQNVRRNFNIIPTTNTALNATLQFNYLDAELGALNENLLTVWKSPDGTSNWVNQGGTVNTALNNVTVSGINDFTWFTLSPTGALPINLTKFAATCSDDKVIISWQTAQEINSSHFEIQSSIDGRIWRVAGNVNAAGYSPAAIDYGFTDAAAGKKYYRLRMVDKDGTFKYSGVVVVNCSNRLMYVTAYPNPAKNNLLVTLTGINRSSIWLQIINTTGQQVWQQQVLLVNNNGRIDVPVQHLPAGIYYIKITEPGYLQTSSFIKQ